MPTVFHLRPAAPANAVGRTALAACALLACSVALAQASSSGNIPANSSAAATPSPSVVSMDAPAGRTRAEVIAELQCARASGEMEAMAMQAYGVPTQPVNRAVPECRAPGGAAVAGHMAPQPAP